MLDVCSRLPETTQIRPEHCNKSLQHIRLKTPLRFAGWDASAVHNRTNQQPERRAESESVREAVLNVVSYHDYRHGGSVFVRQYPRRIEIVSPGEFPPGITATNALWQQSPRNRRIAEVLQLLAEGKSNKETAAALGISVMTVETHRSNIMHKLGAHSVAELVHYAVRHKVITP